MSLINGDENYNEYKTNIIITSILNLAELYNIFFFNDTATTEIYTLSLHDALPISTDQRTPAGGRTIHNVGQVSD